MNSRSNSIKKTALVFILYINNSMFLFKDCRCPDIMTPTDRIIFCEQNGRRENGLEYKIAFTICHLQDQGQQTRYRRFYLITDLIGSQKNLRHTLKIEPRLLENVIDHSPENNGGSQYPPGRRMYI